MSAHHVVRLAALAFASALGLAALLAGTAAISVPGNAESYRWPCPVSSYSMEILVDGSPLATYNAKGTTYVEALKGREYAVRLTNRTGERVAVALAVDGLNSIDAQHTSSREARKWILAPYETVTLSGWQTSSGTARRFVFTSEAKSYGSWLGHTSDLGIISAAFYREVRRADPIAPAPEPMRMRELDKQDSKGALNEDGPMEGVPGGVAGGVVGGVAGGMERAPKDQLAATGIGREIEHHVMQVEFDEEESPASTLSMRYEYRDALVRLGVIPASDDALARRERARGFAEPGFAPDPFRGR